MKYPEFLPDRSTLIWLVAAVPVFIAIDWRINAISRPLAQSDLLPELPAKLTVIEEKTQTVPDVYLRQLAEAAPEEQPASLGMSEKEQLQQQGLVRELFIGRQVYRLQGIVERKGTVAWLQVKDLDTQELSRLELRKGDELSPYFVEDISARQLELVEADRKILLQLFAGSKLSKTAHVE